MTGVFIFVAGASFGACFGFFIAGLMAIAAKESESRVKEKSAGGMKHESNNHERKAV